MSESQHNLHKFELSALLTIIGVILLFSTAVAVTLIAPGFVDRSWTEPSNPYQVQMYTVADPHFYISSTSGNERQQVHYLQKGYSLLAFQETEITRIVAPDEMEKYISRYGEPMVKLTSQLFLLRAPEENSQNNFDATKKAEDLRNKLNEEWEAAHPETQEGVTKPAYEVLELYIPTGDTAFSVADPEGVLENWVDEGEYTFVDVEQGKGSYHQDKGVIYVNNPKEYRISRFKFADREQWRYDANGKPIADLEQLKSHPLGFMSRQELIQLGEHIYAIEGCWYCHTDQTRTLIQDVVLNGSDSYPAPPSSANEYIYQRITFPGTRRIGPDISRVGIKRPSRDWHKGHFWAPKTASPGSIMPPFQHFFDNDPRGTGKRDVNLPNYQFEAIFQYLMTKGTRITPPTQAWWLGKDPVNVKAIIEGKTVSQ